MTSSDLILSFTMHLLDQLGEALDPQVWMGKLIVLERREGRNFVCVMKGQSFTLAPSAAQLLLELGDSRAVDGSVRAAKKLIAALPPIEQMIRWGSIQDTHQTVIRGIGLVGRVVDLVTPKKP